MKRQIRRGVFETNSSSVHSITMCNQSDYEKWENGELIYDRWGDALVPITDENAEIIKNSEDDDYLTFDEFWNDYDKLEYEKFKQNFISQNGDTIVAFGYYGHD